MFVTGLSIVLERFMLHRYCAIRGQIQHKAEKYIQNIVNSNIIYCQ